MRIIHVGAGKPYDVVIGRGILKNCGKLIAPVVSPCKAAIIADDIISGLYADCVMKSLEAEGFSVVKYEFKNGEGQKNLSTVSSMLEFLAAKELTRSDVVVALGGGVTGDMAGFAAAVYLRGIRFIQMPTTFLAMVDSSVGGKTGCNLLAGKNLAGAFYQPEIVICDPDVLQTLPLEEFSSGTAEAIKTGVLGSRPLFDLFKGGVKNENIEKIIEYCVSIKADIVARDEKESNLRQLLNFGHTIAHAVEKLSSYSITHGHAVAMGMSIITRAAAAKGVCSPECAQELLAVLKDNNLPDAAPFSGDDLFTAAAMDKKRKGNMLTLVLPVKVGECCLHTVPLTEASAFFKPSCGTCV